jgi:putative transcriptional regulator
MKKKHSKAGLELIEAMKEVRDHVDEKITLKELGERIRPPRPLSRGKIKLIREKTVHASQGAFARMMNVEKVTVEKWESGRNAPSGAALKLLRIAEKHPEILLEDED